MVATAFSGFCLAAALAAAALPALLVAGDAATFAAGVALAGFWAGEDAALGAVFAAGSGAAFFVIFFAGGTLAASREATIFGAADFFVVVTIGLELSRRGEGAER